MLPFFFDLAQFRELLVEFVSIAVAVEAKGRVVKERKPLVELERALLAGLYKAERIRTTRNESPNGTIQFIFEGV